MSEKLGQVKGLEGLKKKLDRIKRYGHSNLREIQDVHRKVANISRDAIKGKIVDHPVEVRIRRSQRLNGGKRGPDYTVETGTLRRSIQVFTNAVNKMNMLVGPRSGLVARERRAPADGSRIRTDGWFSPMVEMGIRPKLGPGYRGFQGGKAVPTNHQRNKDFFKRGVKSAMTPMRTAFAAGHRALFAQHVKKS